MKVCHLADVHWRGLTRHSEFREVFTRYFDQMRALNPDIIFVGGDIVHSKTQGISPELIDHLVWWFKGLAEIAPTHVILGNHDGIILNADRQDAITPIVTALRDPRVTLYKKSGVYPTGIDGFNWCVFSCFDEPGWSSVKPVPSEVNIALFHGPVWGSKTDIDWQIEGEIDTSFFDGYDFAFLGDIHRQQFLTDDKRIAYSGSTIQHDYSETFQKGFLFWDIRGPKDFDVTFHPVRGSNPFVTIDWQGSVRETVDQTVSLVPGSRVRVRSRDPILPVEWKQLCKELGKTLKALEVVSKTDRDYDITRISADSVSIVKDDLRDPDVQIRLMKQFLKEENVSESEWSQIEGHVRRYMGIISKSDDFVKGGKWSLRRLEFDNTFSYGEGNVINFENLPGITGIFAPNARGKSSIVGTLMYGLFNGTDRGSVKNFHVINARRDHCLAKVTLDVGGDLLRFERQSVKHQDKSGTDYALTHLNLFRVGPDGSILEDQSREQRRVSEIVIRDQIGMAEDFLLTSLASQGEMNNFIKHKNTMRKSILTRFLGLDIFDKMGDMIRDESREIQGQMKSMPDRDWDALVEENRAEQVNLSESLEKTREEFDLLRRQEEEVRKDLSGFTKGEVITVQEVRDQESAVNRITTSLGRCRSKKVELDGDLLEKGRQLEDLLGRREQVSIAELRENLENLRDLEKTLLTLEHSHEREASLLSSQEKSVEKLREVPCGDSFPTCKFIRESHSNKTKISEQRSRVENTLSQVEKMRVNISRLGKQDLEKKISDHEKILKRETDLRIEIERTESKVKQSVSEILQLESQLTVQSDRLVELKSKVIQVDEDERMTLLRSRLDDLQSRIRKLDSSRMMTASRLGSLQASVSQIVLEKEKYLQVKGKWRVYDLLQQAISKRGIPLQIIMSQLPHINSEISKILQGVVSFTVELEADIGSNDLDVFINYGDSRRIVEVASGMEKMIASLAIRVALINVSALPKSDMLIIDEGFGTLDDLNVEACNRMLVSLKKWFKSILIITHIDAVKDIVDNVVDITWNEKDAQVIYT